MHHGTRHTTADRGTRQRRVGARYSCKLIQSRRAGATANEARMSNFAALGGAYIQYSN